MKWTRATISANTCLMRALVEGKLTLIILNCFDPERALALLLLSEFTDERYCLLKF